MANETKYTVELLQLKVREFIDAVNAGSIDIPDDYRLCEFLGITHETYDRWLDNSDKYEGKYTAYGDVLRKNMTPYREHWYLQEAKNSKNPAFQIFCLKQAKNGGYVDKETKSFEPVKLEVSINGVKNAFE